MKFQVGVFAKLEDVYVYETGRYTEQIVYSIHHWCDEAGVKYRRDDYGETLVTIHEFEFDEGQGVTREILVRTMVEGMRSRQTAIQADAAAQCNELDRKINKLLALPQPDGWEVV